ncbi:MAG: cohesin domain-containing protein [Desulfococcaceae bacterium]|jgi:hypothetical protein|nr:cohesin domain-containing protein [Desulfococcaceae bacterium]
MLKNICVFILTGFICLFSDGIKAEIRVSVPLHTGISPGESVIFPVHLSGAAPETGIRGYSFRIVYDAELLSNPAAIRAGTLSESVSDDNFTSARPYDDIGMYSLAAYGVSFAQDGVLVNIRFDVRPDATAVSASIIFVSPNRKTVLFTGGYETVPAGFIPLQADTDGDGDTDLGDAIAALRILSGLSPEHVQALADIDNDRRIGMAEAVFILNYVAED